MANEIIDISYTGQDAEDEVSSIVVKYSLSGLFTGEEVVATQIASDPAHDGISGLAFTAAGAPFNFVWDGAADLGVNFIGNAHIEITPNDGNEDGLKAYRSEFISFLPVSKDDEATMVNISSKDIGIRVSGDRKHFRKRVAPLEAFACPGFVVEDLGIIGMINDSKLKVIRHAKNGTNKLKNKSAHDYMLFGKVTLASAQTSTEVSEERVITTGRVLLTPANATAAALGDVFVEQLDVSEGSFRITHPSAAGTEEFNWLVIADE